MQVRRLSIAALLWGITALPAWPGAWLGDKDTGCLSLSTSFRNTDTGLAVETDGYVEYGAWSRVTLGAAVNETQGRSGHVLAFVRLPINVKSQTTKWAAEIGLGAWHLGPDWKGMGKLTLSYGRGLSWGDNAGGWLSVDASVEQRQGHASPTWALNSTIGQSSGRKLRPMVKLGAEYIEGKTLGWSASGHLLIDGPKEITWVVGLERKRSGASTTALSLGLWRNF